MTRTSRPALLPLLSALAFDLAAVGVLALGGGTRWLVAAGLHGIAVAAVAVARRLTRSQRALVAALTLTLPVMGAVLAMVALATRRRGEVGQVAEREPPKPLPLSLTGIRRITDGLSVWESLMSGSAAERRATVAMLARRRDADSYLLLRRAVAVGSADVAVDAAMALEEITNAPDREKRAG